MSIIDHGHTYDIKYDGLKYNMQDEKNDEEFSGKFFWFSGFNLNFNKAYAYDLQDSTENAEANFEVPEPTGQNSEEHISDNVPVIQDPKSNHAERINSEYAEPDIPNIAEHPDIANSHNNRKPVVENINYIDAAENFASPPLKLNQLDEQIYMEPEIKPSPNNSPRFVSDYHHDDIFTEEPCYMIPDEIMKRKTDVINSLYEIPVDQKNRQPEYEFHHYDLPDVVQPSTHIPRTYSKHEYELPDLNKVKNHERLPKNQYENLVNLNSNNKPISESDIPNTQAPVLNSEIEFEESFNAEIPNETSNPVFQNNGRYFKLKEKDTDSESSDKTADNSNKTADVSNKLIRTESEYIDPEEIEIHADSNHSDGDINLIENLHVEELTPRPKEHYAGGMWFGFSARQHTAQSMENLLAIDGRDSKPSKEDRKHPRQTRKPTAEEPRIIAKSSQFDEELPPPPPSFDIETNVNNNKSTEDNLSEHFKEIEQLMMDSFVDLDFGEPSADETPEVTESEYFVPLIDPEDLKVTKQNAGSNETHRYPPRWSKLEKEKALIRISSPMQNNSPAEPLSVTKKVTKHENEADKYPPRWSKLEKEKTITQISTPIQNNSPAEPLSEKKSWNVSIETSPSSKFQIKQNIDNLPIEVKMDSYIQSPPPEEKLLDQQFEKPDSKWESYHRQPTINLTEGEDESLPNNTPDGKPYSIEITPDLNELEINDNTSYHVTFIKKDKPEANNKIYNVNPKSPSIERHLEQKPTISNQNSVTTASFKTTTPTADREVRPHDKNKDSLPRQFNRDIKSISHNTNSLPRQIKKSTAPLQKSYSMKEPKTSPRHEMKKSESFDSRRSSRSSRNQDEPIDFSSLRSIFEKSKNIDNNKNTNENKHVEPRNKLNSNKPMTSSNINKKEPIREDFIKQNAVKDQFEAPVLPSFDSPELPKLIQQKEKNRKMPERCKTPEMNVLPQRRASVKITKLPHNDAVANTKIVSATASPSPRNLRRSKDDSDQPRISIKSQQSPKIKKVVRSKSFGAKPNTNNKNNNKNQVKLTEEVINQNENEMKIFYQFDNKSADSANKTVDSSKQPELENNNKSRNNVQRHRKMKSTSSLPKKITGDISSDEDAANLAFSRGTSFRRSIVIEDEVSQAKRKQSQGEKFVSVFFTPINPNENADEQKNSFCQQFKTIFTYLDKMSVHVEHFASYFDAVKSLQSLFWDLKDNEERVTKKESVTSVLNHLVSQEWPKVILGCLRKLQQSYKHVFHQNNDPDSIIYYSGHMPSLLRMNRTSAEFAMAVIFDGLIKTAINFTDVHEASRIACCEENLIGYLLTEIVPLLHEVHWGKKTARESFLKSISDLTYNCSQTSNNTSYLIKHGAVELIATIMDETYDIVDAKKVFMTNMLTSSFLMDSDNIDVIIPTEGYIIRLLQFLDKSLEHSEHTYLDFYAAELTSCLSRMASHDSNKLIITRNSGQEILHKLIKHAYDDEEKTEACTALWNLSFNHEAKDMLRDMSKLINALRAMKGSSNLFLRRAASGVIWECEEKYDLKGTREIHTTLPNHVMISYELESQPLVIGIRDELHRRGFKVWMNSDADERSLQEIMTNGVERSTIVILAVSRKYKQTPHCYAEADYAHKLRKHILPIIIDDFVMDGWLLNLIESTKTFDFTKQSMYHGSLDALFDHVKEISGEDKQNIDQAINKSTSSTKRDKNVLSWSNNDVISWLTENKLLKTANKNHRLEKLTGLHLLMFHDLKKESPDYYYTVLDSHLGFKDVLHTMEFSYALDRLLATERLI